MNITIEDKYGKTLIHGMLKIKLNMSFKEQITSIDIQYINFWNMDGVHASSISVVFHTIKLQKILEHRYKEMKICHDSLNHHLL